MYILKRKLIICIFMCKFYIIIYKTYTNIYKKVRIEENVKKIFSQKNLSSELLFDVILSLIAWKLKHQLWVKNEKEGNPLDRTNFISVVEKEDKKD